MSKTLEYLEKILNEENLQNDIITTDGKRISQQDIESGKYKWVTIGHRHVLVDKDGNPVNGIRRWNKKHNPMTVKKRIVKGNTDTTERREKYVGTDASGNTTAHNSLYKYSDDKGNLTRDRELLHKRIMAEHFQHAGKDILPAKGKKTYTFLGGGAASGKSTILNEYSESMGLPTKADTVFMNADDIKGRLPDYIQMAREQNEDAAAYVHEESSALQKRINETVLDDGYNGLLDGTGDGTVDKMKKKIAEARKKGAIVNGIYATTSIEEALKRESKRANETGRHVRKDKLIEIHKAVSEILPQIARDFDNVKLFDTTSAPPVLIAEGGNGRDLTPVKGREKEYQAFLNKVYFNSSDLDKKDKKSI